jgi:hypothetical protein
MNPNQQPANLDDWLSEGLEEQVRPVPEPPPKAESRFPTVPTGSGVKKEPPKPVKPKSLADLGISKGGTVRLASTVVRTQLENPVTNPKKPPGGVKTTASSVLDSSDLPPEFGVPQTIMTSMDADLEQRAKDRINSVGHAGAPVETQPQQSSAPAPAAGSVVTTETTLGELLSATVARGGSFRLENQRFVLEIVIRA